jgi:NTP pyrophosphatase (non-canonical NTP hydrolase)
MMAEHFNGLTPAQAEALAVLAEEAGEVIQAIGKSLRHGLDSAHPDGGADNMARLSIELGDLKAAVNIAATEGLIDVAQVNVAFYEKMRRIVRYLHHVGVAEVEKD